MKKVTVFSLLLSLSPVLLNFLFNLTPWNSLFSNIPGTEGNHPENTVTKSDPAFSASTLSLTSLPLMVPEDSVGRLETLHDQDLQTKLEAILHSNQHWVALSKSNSLSIGIVDMQDPMHSRFASINENNMVYAASLPKIAVLLASEDAIEQGRLVETPAVKADMRLMIAKSNNEAATRMIERVGIKQIGQVLQDP